MSSGYTEFEIPEETARVLLLMGHAEDKGEYLVLTEAGDKWLREWCAKKLAEHEGRA